MADKQNQTAGDNAQQLQANQMVVNYSGIDEKRAREIYKEMNLQLRKDYSEEAFKIASSRVAEFENRLLPKMEAVDGALRAFTDPGFQLLLVEAQKTAASTERPDDYDLLAELLVHRVQKGENRIKRAGISRAVEIVDEISDEALLGLTVFHAVNHFLPVAGNIDEGLYILNDLFGKILYGILPSGKDWLEHLEILDAVRINLYGGLQNFYYYYLGNLDGYIDVGIEKNTENYSKAIEILNSNQFSHDMLVDHKFNTNFIRINLPSRKLIDVLSSERVFIENGQYVTVKKALTQQQKNSLSSLYDLYKKDETLKQKNIQMFKQELDKYENLRRVKEWYNSLFVSIQLTAVGRVLAHSNAQRCDKNLPPLD